MKTFKKAAYALLWTLNFRKEEREKLFSVF